MCAVYQALPRPPPRVGPRAPTAMADAPAVRRQSNTFDHGRAPSSPGPPPPPPPVRRSSNDVAAAGLRGPPSQPHPHDGSVFNAPGGEASHLPPPPPPPPHPAHDTAAPDAAVFNPPSTTSQPHTHSRAGSIGGGSATAVGHRASLVSHASSQGAGRRGSGVGVAPPPPDAGGLTTPVYAPPHALGGVPQWEVRDVDDGEGAEGGSRGGVDDLHDPAVFSSTEADVDADADADADERLSLKTPARDGSESAYDADGPNGHDADADADAPVPAIADIVHGMQSTAGSGVEGLGSTRRRDSGDGDDVWDGRGLQQMETEQLHQHHHHHHHTPSSIQPPDFDSAMETSEHDGSGVGGEGRFSPPDGKTPGTAPMPMPSPAAYTAPPMYDASRHPFRSAPSPPQQQQERGGAWGSGSFPQQQQQQDGPTHTRSRRSSVASASSVHSPDELGVHLLKGGSPRAAVANISASRTRVSAHSQYADIPRDILGGYLTANGCGLIGRSGPSEPGDSVAQSTDSECFGHYHHSPPRHPPRPQGGHIGSPQYHAGDTAPLPPDGGRLDPVAIEAGGGLEALGGAATHASTPPPAGGIFRSGMSPQALHTLGISRPAAGLASTKVLQMQYRNKAGAVARAQENLTRRRLSSAAERMNRLRETPLNEDEIRAVMGRVERSVDSIESRMHARSTPAGARRGSIPDGAYPHGAPRSRSATTAAPAPRHLSPTPTGGRGAKGKRAGVSPSKSVRQRSKSPAPAVGGGVGEGEELDVDEELPTVTSHGGRGGEDDFGDPGGLARTWGGAPPAASREGTSPVLAAAAPHRARPRRRNLAALKSCNTRAADPRGENASLLKRFEALSQRVDAMEIHGLALLAQRARDEQGAVQLRGTAAAAAATARAQGDGGSARPQPTTSPERQRSRSGGNGQRSRSAKAERGGRPDAFTPKGSRSARRGRGRLLKSAADEGVATGREGDPAWFDSVQSARTGVPVSVLSHTSPRAGLGVGGGHQRAASPRVVKRSTFHDPPLDAESSAVEDAAGGGGGYAASLEGCRWPQQLAPPVPEAIQEVRDTAIQVASVKIDAGTAPPATGRQEEKGVDACDIRVFDYDKILTDLVERQRMNQEWMARDQEVTTETREMLLQLKQEFSTLASKTAEVEKMAVTAGTPARVEDSRAAGAASTAAGGVVRVPGAAPLDTAMEHRMMQLQLACSESALAAQRARDDAHCALQTSHLVLDKVHAPVRQPSDFTQYVTPMSPSSFQRLATAGVGGQRGMSAPPPPVPLPMHASRTQHPAPPPPPVNALGVVAPAPPPPLAPRHNDASGGPGGGGSVFDTSPRRLPAHTVVATTPTPYELFAALLPGGGAGAAGGGMPGGPRATSTAPAAYSAVPSGAHSDYQTPKRAGGAGAASPPGAGSPQLTLAHQALQQNSASSVSNKWRQKVIDSLYHP